MIFNSIKYWASQRPNAVAVIDHDVKVTYYEFSRAIHATRNLLSHKELGLPSRGVVAIMSSGFPMWCIQLALRSMGLDTVFVQNLTAAAALNFKDLAAVVTTQRDIAVRGADSRLAFACKLITLPDGFWRATDVTLPEEIDSQFNIFGNHFLYTSGTTGHYKKVMSDWRFERRIAERFARLGFVKEDTISHVLNFGAHTSLGYREPISAWFFGATIIIDERSDAVSNLMRHYPTKIRLTPDIAYNLAKQEKIEKSAKLMPEISVGGGFVSYKILQQLNRMGFVHVTNSFGSTECSRTLYSLVDSEDSLVWLQPYPDRQVEIVDEDGRVCKNGQEGKLRIRLLDIDASGYFDDAEATASAFSDGWFYTGDLAISRQDGRIRIVGRAGDVINLMGAKKATAPYEQAVQQITHASAVCIFQEVHVDGTDELVIALETTHSPSSETVERIRALFANQIALRVEIFPEFPRTTLGMSKIQRLQLRNMVFG